MAELSIKALRDSLKLDQSEALKTLYTEYHDYCIANMRSKLNLDEDDAKDLFIESLLIFRRNVLSGKVEHLTSMKSYILSVCLNLGRAKYRSETRKDAQADEVESRLYANDDTDESENSRKIQALEAFKLLTEACQKILTLFYVHRLTMNEVATEQGLANDKVAKVQKARCLRKWEQSIQELADGTIR